jgi:hypothetical protein
MAHTSTSRAARASTTTTTTIANVPKESKESEDSNLEDCFVAHVEDPISSSGDEFDD